MCPPSGMGFPCLNSPNSFSMKPFPFLLLVLTCASHASALSLSLGEVASRVRIHHPALKAARLAIEEARGRQLGSGRLSNPTFGYDFQNQSNVSPQTGVFSIDQSFPITRRLSLEKKLTSQLVTAAELEIRDVERKLISDAQQQVVQLLTLSKQRALRQQQTELAQKLSEFASGRAKAGEVSPLDAKQVQLDAQRLRVESRLLEAQSVSLLGQLKPMLVASKMLASMSDSNQPLQPLPISRRDEIGQLIAAFNSLAVKLVQREDALRESEERYRTLVENSPESIAVHAGGNIIYVNPAAMAMFGAESPQALVGTPIIDRVQPDFRESQLARVEAIASHGLTLPMAEVQLLKMDGTTIDAAVQGNRITYDGAPAVQVTMRDVTERKRAERDGTK